MEDFEEKLKLSPRGEIYKDGYRIVYFDNEEYVVGEYCKSIEGFMIGFAENDPIIDEDDIPSFISTDDLLNRYLNEMKKFSKVSLYKIDGECIATKHRNKAKSK